MSRVRLTGTTSGFTEITAPATAGNNTITLPSSNGGANQLLKNSGTAGALEFASNVTLDASGLTVDGFLKGTATVGALVASNGGGDGQTSLMLTRDGAATDQKRWEILHGGSSGTLTIRAINDAYNQASDFLRVFRGSGVLVDSAGFYTNGAERLRLSGDGTLLLGTDTAFAVGPFSAADIQHYIYSTTAGTSHAVVAAANNTNGATIHLGKSRGGTSTIVANGDNVGAIQFAAANGVNLTSRAAALNVQIDGAPSSTSTPGRYIFATTAAGNTSPSESMRIDSAGQVFCPRITTTASAANAFLNSGSTPANQLLRSTSSLRYKTDIEDVETERADAILGFRPVWYRSTAEADRGDWSWYGLIAEEVAEIEPRLVHWGYADDAYEEVDGERQLKPDAEQVPDGVQYDRLTVLLLDVVQRQQERIESLEARLAALEANS